MTRLKETLLEYLLVAVIFTFTVAARFYHPDLQSLWFDELYTMTVANPDQSYGDIATDLSTDFHPPLHYFLLNTLFQFMPYNDLTGRYLSIVTGCLTIMLVYKLGRGLRDKSTGYALALLFSVFFYHIKYSQEVRMYIYMFGLAIISTLIFLKEVKRHYASNVFNYVLVGALMVYTQYYGFFIMMGHGFCLWHLRWRRNIRKRLVWRFVLMWLAILLLYLPWLPVVFQTAGTKHFMKLPAPWYFFEYLYEYTGKEPVTTLFILIGLGLYGYDALHQKHKISFRPSPYRLVVQYIAGSVFVVTYFISIFKPMLSKHSTLVGLPFLMVMVIHGYLTLRRNHLKWILPVVVVANIVNLLFVNEYYFKPVKENFRGITEVVKKDNRYGQNQVVVSQLYRFYNYYFEQQFSPLRARNPNEELPTNIPYKPATIVVINAPFTHVTTPELEPVDALGFRILNPRLLSRADSTAWYLKQWNDYLKDYYTVDATYHDPMTGKAVAYRFKLLK